MVSLLLPLRGCGRRWGKFLNCHAAPFTRRRSPPKLPRVALADYDLSTTKGTHPCIVAPHPSTCTLIETPRHSAVVGVGTTDCGLIRWTRSTLEGASAIP